MNAKIGKFFSRLRCHKDARKARDEDNPSSRPNTETGFRCLGGRQLNSLETAFEYSSANNVGALFQGSPYFSSSRSLTLTDGSMSNLPTAMNSETQLLRPNAVQYRPAQAPGRFTELLPENEIEPEPRNGLDLERTSPSFPFESDESEEAGGPVNQNPSIVVSNAEIHNIFSTDDVYFVMPNSEINSARQRQQALRDAQTVVNRLRRPLTWEHSWHANGHEHESNQTSDDGPRHGVVAARRTRNSLTPVQEECDRENILDDFDFAPLEKCHARTW